jgi:TonB family protein
MKLYLRLAIVLLTCNVLLGASGDRTQEGKDLINAAIEKTNIFALPHFALKGNIQIKDKGKPINGAYLLVWNGPDEWKEEISLPGYFEKQVGAKGVVYLKRTVDFTPLRIEQLHSTLGYGSSLGPGLNSFVQIAPRSGETVQKISDRKIRGIKAKCVEITSVEKNNREVCIDASSGTLLRKDSFLDKEMMPTDTKVFPRLLSYEEHGDPIIEVRITELSTSHTFSSADFMAPTDASSRPGCMNPVPFHMIHRVDPKYPQEDRQSRTQGTVSVYALIAKDGSVQNARVVSGVSTGLNNATLDAIKQWHYEPATCNGVPVDTETVLTANYILSGY